MGEIINFNDVTGRTALRETIEWADEQHGVLSLANKATLENQFGGMFPAMMFLANYIGHVARAIEDDIKGKVEHDCEAYQSKLGTLQGCINAYAGLGSVLQLGIKPEVFDTLKGPPHRFAECTCGECEDG